MYRKLVIVLLALIVTGLSISVIGTLCLAALEPNSVSSFGQFSACSGVAIDKFKTPS